MIATRTCRKCGSHFSGGALEGLCPSCVGRLAFVSELEAVAAPASIASGTKLRYFGDYELLEEIARGGMGVVYKARQLSLNRIVAVKMILSGKLASAADVARFRAEAELAANLRHPHIVAIHEVGEQDGQHYFSMDYVAGNSLSELLTAHPLPSDGRGIKGEGWFRRVAGWLKTIAEAIYYAHQQGTLHRDLKPSNVLIDSSDQPHITDFGLAKRVKHDSDLTVSGQILGTPNFMSPEQAAGKRGGAGPQSDVYSLGAILYFLLTGKPPHAGETVHETLSQVANAAPAAPRSLNPAVPRDLETICLKCLEKEPRRRYTSAQELAQDLDRFLNDEPILARRPGPVERVLRTCNRHRLVAALSVALILLSITVAVMVGRNAGRPGFSPIALARPPVAEMPTNCAEGVAGVIDGKIYITSARDGNSESYPRSLYAYDPKRSLWKRLTDSSFVHADGAGGVIAGKLYVAGGSDEIPRPSSVLEVYDPDSNSWSTKAPMPTARSDCAGAVLNGKLYVLGGIRRTNYLSTVESFDPDTGKWTTEDPMLTARAGLGAAVLASRLYAIGGGTNDSLHNLAAAPEFWEPGVKWTAITNRMLTPTAHAFVVASGGAIYVAGGRENGGVGDLQFFEPQRKNLWDIRKSMPAARFQGCGTVALDGEIYCFGGWDDLPGLGLLVPHADVFVYSVQDNSWRSSVQAGRSTR